MQAAQKKLKSLAKQNKDRHHNYEITEAHEKSCALFYRKLLLQFADWFFGIIEAGEKNADRKEDHGARRGRNDVYGAVGAVGAPATQDRRRSGF